MGNLVIDMSMSLDGYIAAPNDNPEQGLGEDGMRLQLGVRRPVGIRAGVRQPGRGNGREWAADRTTTRSRPGVARARLVMSRASWSPTVRPRAPTRCSPSSPTGSSALAKAQEVAGDKAIGLMGANVDQQFLAAGLVDGIRIHLVNVLLGGGRRLFDRLPQRIELEQTGLTETDGVTHLTYRVVR